MHYGNSIMTTYYDGLQGQEQEPCIVIFREDALIIEYNRDGKPRSYREPLSMASINLATDLRWNRSRAQQHSAPRRKV